MPHFDSVNEFLRKARQAKNAQRPEVEECLAETFEDPHVIAVPPELGEMIEDLTESYGDEALRQIALFCMGKWFGIHTAYIEDLVNTESMHEVVSTTMDAAKISQCVTMLELVSSFSGVENWREMVKELAVGAVNDALNQRGFEDND
mgnify:CR=1 FL=1